MGCVNNALKDAEGPQNDGGWICEGNYRVALTNVWGRSDVIVYLDTSPLLRIMRVLRREFGNWLRGNVNNVGRVSSILHVRFWLGLLKGISHASGLSYQQASLRENLKTFHVHRSEKREKCVQEREELRVAANQVQYLQGELASLKGTLQEKKQAGDSTGASQCICKIKEVTSALAIAAKQAKAGRQLKVPAIVPVVILQTQADIDALKLQLCRHQS